MNKCREDDLEFVSQLLTSMYVNDYASCADTIESAFELCAVKMSLAEGGFNMRKWVSNSRDLIARLSESPEFPEVRTKPEVNQVSARMIKETVSLFSCNVAETRPSVLGQVWNNCKDELNFAKSVAK